jgi:hypothetical protein
MTDPDVAAMLARLDDTQLAAAVSEALADRQAPTRRIGEPVDWVSLSDDDFYAAMYPHTDKRRGPAPLRMPDDES